MSHGGDDSSADPDLTPLLDLVLQLLMFFIINVNFMGAQANPEIKLPRSASARPMDKPADADIYLNQRTRTEAYFNRLPPYDQERLRNADSVVLVPGKPPMSMLEVRAWLKDQRERVDAETANRMVVHFRPDGDLDVGELLKLMNACKMVGFKNIKMHAVIGK